jgi:hypothetical protein
MRFLGQQCYAVRDSAPDLGGGGGGIGFPSAIIHCDWGGGAIGFPSAVNGGGGGGMGLPSATMFLWLTNIKVVTRTDTATANAIERFIELAPI